MHVFLSLFLWIGVNITSVKGNIDSHLDDAKLMQPLTEVLTKLSEKYEVIFSYETKLLQEVEVDFEFIKEENVDSAIERLLSHTGLRYQTIGSKYYVIHKNTKKSKKNAKKIRKLINQIHKLEQKGELSLKNNQISSSGKLTSIVHSIVELKEEVLISGQVTSTDGEPLIGVNVLVKGTSSVGTITDLDGRYQLSVPDDATTLIFSYTGFEAYEEHIDGRTIIDVRLEEGIGLQEVVVVGYSTQTKESITGSVGVINSKTLEQAPVSTFEQALKGSVAGLQASAIDGAPGANTQIRIRGIGSMTASSEPLYVIDGIPIQAGSIATNDNDGRSTNVMSAINPNDIESVTVLKDAASTAIYGSRGANGVILITTKSGNADEPTFTFKALTGFNSVASNNILKPLNAAQYTQLFLEGYINRGDTPEEAQQKFDDRFQQLIDPATGRPTDTNWLDAITRTGITQSYDLSASGGNENMNYFFSGGYFDQENYIIGSDFRRISARANLEFKVNDFITIENNISIADMSSNTFNDGGSWDNPLKATLELSPLIPIYDEQGRFNGEHTNYFPMAGSNPVGMLSGEDLRETVQIRVIDNFAASVAILDNLTFRSQWNFDVISLDESEYKNPRFGGGSRGDNGTAYNATILSKSWVGTQTLNYDLELGADNNINLLAGYEAQKSTMQSHSAFGAQFPNGKLRTLNSASGEFAVTGARSEFTFASMFARVNYNYARKYYLSSSVRRDGSSRFGADNRWGTFYSVGASWIVTREAFLKDNSVIDLLKVRSSWGLTGNAAIGNFPSQGLYTYGQDYDSSPGGSPSQIGNPSLTWETQKNFNIGLDFGLFSRIDGTVEYFKRISSDLILDVPISRTTGFSSLTQNFGEMTNTGVEIALNVDIISKEDFGWRLGFNTTFLKNKITNLTEDFIDGVYRREQGQDFQSFYVYGFAGIDQSNGAIQYYTDETKEEITNGVSNARRFLDNKSATPDFYGGLNTSVNFKGISLDASLNYSWGNYIFDGRARGSLSDGRLTPRSTATWAFENRWVPGKTDALLPQHRWGGSPGSGERATSRWLYDGSFIRLRDLTMAYFLPESVISPVGVNSIRVYVRGTNLWTFTKDRDLYMDPEQAINGTYDALTPANKTISFGIDVQF